MDNNICIKKLDSNFFVYNDQAKIVHLPNINVTEKILTGFSPAMTKIIKQCIGHKDSINTSNYMDIMRQLELLDYEPASDKGHYRFYPKGALIYELFKELLEKEALDSFQAIPIKTPFLYQADYPGIQQQIEPFKQRLYFACSPENNDQFVLRFGDDLGLFSLMHDCQLTFRYLPIRLSEHVFGFRYNQSGELSGIRRGRYFSFVDIHSFCAGLEQSLDEYSKLLRTINSFAQRLNLDLINHFRIVKDFYNQNAKKLQDLILLMEREALVEILPYKRQYWTMKNIVYTHNPQKLFHVQLDLENAIQYEISYKDFDNVKKSCIIIHTSLGSIEKWFVITMEDALKKSPPQLPLWLSPIQVRIIPVSDSKHLDFCLKLGQDIRSNRIRADVDDRTESVNKRIREAEREWVPYIIVCGDKEQSGSLLSVRIRGEKQQQQMSVSELIEIIKKQTSEMPFRQFPGIQVSKRPVFRGRD